VDLELATLLGGANLRQSKQNFLKVHRRLADALAAIDQDKYDVALIDCPPNFNIVTKTAIVASDFILVPTRPDFLSTLGIDYLIRNVNELVEDYNDYASDQKSGETEKISPATIGVLFNMVQETSSKPIAAQDAYIQQVRRQSGLHVFDSYIKLNNTIFATAPESGVPVVLNAYTSGSHTNVVAGLERVATEFASIVGV
jgi:chromosome partitioning protein